MRAFDVAWQRAQYDAGWAGIAWEERYGGRGLSAVQQVIWHEEYAKAHAPWIGSCFVGVNHAGPTLIGRANESQKEFHLPKILRGDTIWCQGFSEPNAGSDLASLQMIGEIDGDHLVVSGQKIWTTFADVADYQELLVRTDQTAPKHRGISWVICDMASPGIEVRPIRNMAGDGEFSEVFYERVRIPLANVVGGLGNGWSVAMATLGFERGAAMTADQMELWRKVEDLIEVAKQVPGPEGEGTAWDDDELRRRLAHCRAGVNALRAMTLLNVSRGRRQEAPGAEASISKVYWSILQQEVFRLAMEIIGPDALVLTGFEDGWTRSYLRSYQATIAAGTTEIQRNIIGERLLGLPRA
jgi:alkylation response protein AidB-like acyl-CoA dehydrogenase